MTRALAELRAALDRRIVGQPAATTAVLLALLAREHAWLEGPPGCGKTRLAESLAALAAMPLSQVACHRALRADAVLATPLLWRRPVPGGERLSVTRAPGPLAGAALLVLDDLPRAPGEAVAPLLAGFAAGTSRVESVLATATLAPGDDEDAPAPALLDRFAVQVRMSGVAARDMASARRLLALDPETPACPVLDTELRHALQRRTAGTPVPPALRAVLLDLLRRLAALARAGRSEGGPAAGWSDRAAVRGALGLVRAHAVLRGAGEAGRPDLEALRFMLARRVPAGLLPAAEAEIAAATQEGGGARDAPSAPAHASDGGRSGAGAGSCDAAPRSDDGATQGVAPATRAPVAVVDVAQLLRALAGRLDAGGVESAPDPGGTPRRQRRLVRLDEIDDADPVEAALFVEARLPDAPRVLRRERRVEGGAVALLRDVSASMEGELGAAAGRVVAGLVRLAARRRMRLGYLEFHHAAEPFPVDGRFFHRRYGRLLALASRARAEGRTSYEAPLRAALAAFAARDEARRLAPRSPGREARHVVLLTDGVPVVGDPAVARERAQARRLGVAVHTVYLGAGAPPPVLVALARETGGGAFVLSCDADGPGLVARAADLHTGAREALA